MKKEGYSPQSSNEPIGGTLHFIAALSFQAQRDGGQLVMLQIDTLDRMFYTSGDGLIGGG